MGRRIRWLGIVVLLCFGLIMIQLTNVQFRRANALANSPQNPKVAQARYDQGRGDILASDGTVLATSTKAPSGDIYKYQRTYPTGSLFSQIVGFDSFDYGNYGVESTYNQYLVPHKLQPHSLGDLLSPRTSTNNISLTVQPSLQQVAQQALAGRDGAVVALNPRNGAIEALYSNPTYDPNPLVSLSTNTEHSAWNADLAKDQQGFAPLSNVAVSQRFPPGSTFKIITASTAYDHQPQLINKQYPQQTCTSLPQSNQQLCNSGNGSCGGNIPSMVPPSCDTGFAEVGMDLGGNNLFDQANAFGYNRAPPVDFTTVGGITPSNFPNPNYFAPDQHGQPGLAYAGIGQDDVSASALQGALEAAAIANQGVIMKPHVMSQIRDSQGNVVTTYTPSMWTRATSASTASTLVPLMQQVVTSGTAAQVGFPAQYQVAAKTGTAQSGVNNAFNTDWLIAFAPATNPKIAVAAVLTQQAQTSFGAECSGPVVNDVIQAALGANPANLPSPTAGCPTP